VENVVDNCEESPAFVNNCTHGVAQVVLVFAKQPRPGHVKTRLTPPLSALQATIFYAFSQSDTLCRLQQLSYKIVICYSGEREFFKRRYPGIELCEQGDGDLGERLQRMFSLQWQRGAKQICVVGTDSPDLPMVWIDEVFDLLNNYDVITIPASDGGYVLLGCSCDCPKLFQNISWSTELVNKQTLDQAQRAGCRYTSVHQWQDVDDIAALRSYAIRSRPESNLPWGRSGKYARRCLRQIVEKVGRSGNGEARRW